MSFVSMLPLSTTFLLDFGNVPTVLCFFVFTLYIFMGNVDNQMGEKGYCQFYV